MSNDVSEVEDVLSSKAEKKSNFGDPGRGATSNRVLFYTPCRTVNASGF